MALHLLERAPDGARRLAAALGAALESVRHCRRCRNFSDSDLCDICADDRREQDIICVVESPADVLAVEASGAYRGRYFVLLGRLSPLDGYGPAELGLEALEAQLKALTQELETALGALDGDIGKVRAEAEHKVRTDLGNEIEYYKVELAAAKESLAKQEEAVEDQIFGVPLFVFNGEQFWGHDRIWLLEHRLKEAGLGKSGTEAAAE